MSINCWEGRHLSIVRFVTIPGLFIYVFLIPIVLACNIYANRELIDQQGERKTRPLKEQQQIEDFMTSYGFMFNGNKSEDCLYEF